MSILPHPCLPCICVSQSSVSRFYIALLGMRSALCGGGRLWSFPLTGCHSGPRPNYSHLAYGRLENLLAGGLHGNCLSANEFCSESVSVSHTIAYSLSRLSRHRSELARSLKYANFKNHWLFLAMGVVKSELQMRSCVGLYGVGWRGSKIKAHAWSSSRVMG